ncbi:uncharacterized protein LOC132752442 isoform X2 [Ruditapes philippinarum]|nr:uncharacterized protein LOC132752442 isoform X2 [Ruditapes philippinarum]
MDGGLQDDLTMDDLTNDDNYFRDSRDIDKTIRMFLNKEETATPVYTPSLSARKNDLSLFTLSPITFIDRTYHVNLLNMVASGSEVSGCEVSGCEVSGSEVSGCEVSGCNSFQALIGSSALGISGSEMRKLYSPETLSTVQMKFTTEKEHEDLSNEKVSAEIMTKTAYQSNVIHRPACNFGATSLFTCIKNLMIVLLCFGMVNLTAGGPVLDKGKMDDKDGGVYLKFPLLESNWCQNPEQSTDTCPNKDRFMEYKVTFCQYKCPDGEKVLCLESEVGMVFFCIPKDIRCVKGIGWQVEGIEHRGFDKFVTIKEGTCPAGFYQSRPSKCYDACKDEHEPIHLIPLAFKIVSLGNNTHPTMLRCKHEDGFYNPKNKSYNRFNQDDFQKDFCINVRDLNPCKSGQMPLYNGTCVNHCSPGYVRDDTDFFCKLNGTLEHAGNNSSEAGPKKEIEVGKEEGKDGDSDFQRSKEGNKSGHPNQFPGYFIVICIIGFVIILVVLLVVLIKVFCFPNRSETSGAYSQVPTDSKTSSEVTLEGTDKGKSGDVESISLDTFSTSEGTEKGKSRDVESNSLDTLSTSKDGDDASDSPSDEESESKVDDELFPKEAIDIQTLAEEEISPVKSSSSKSSGFKVKKKYDNNLFIAIDKVGTLNFGSVSSNKDTSGLMKSLCDGLQIPEESVKSFFVKKMDSEKIVSEKDEEGNGQEEELSQDVEILTPKVGGNVTSEVDRGAGEEFASPYSKTLTQLVVNGFAEHMKSVGALIYNGEVIGTVSRAGDDYLITASHVIRRIIDPGNTGQADFSLIEAENVFINFNASVCETPEYKFRVRHVFLSTDTRRLDFTILQITNRNDALPKGLKLDKRPGNTRTKTLHGIGYGDPENPYCKVLDNSCPIIPSINTRILDCETWLYDNNRGFPDQNVPPVAQNGAYAGTNRIQRFRALVQEMGSDPCIVDKGYKYIDREQNIFLDICLEHRGSGSPFLTSDGFVKGILTNGHPEFFYLLPKLVQAGFPSDKRFECILKLEYVHQNISERDPVLANKLFG